MFDHAVAHLELKQGWTGIKIAQMANNDCCVPLCNNDKQYDCGKDLSYFNFRGDKQER